LKLKLSVEGDIGEEWVISAAGTFLPLLVSLSIQEFRFTLHVPLRDG
jgi:hypothetical protein